MDKEAKEKIVEAVVEKLKVDTLYKDLLKEKAPEESEKIFKDFLFINKINEKNEIQEVLKDLKLKELFNVIFAYPGMEPVWQKMKKEYKLSGFVFRVNI